MDSCFHVLCSDCAKRILDTSDRRPFCRERCFSYETYDQMRLDHTIVQLAESRPDEADAPTPTVN